MPKLRKTKLLLLEGWVGSCESLDISGEPPASSPGQAVQWPFEINYIVKQGLLTASHSPAFSWPGKPQRNLECVCGRTEELRTSVIWMLQGSVERQEFTPASLG